MSRQINQPINQVRLTNVAVVRHTVNGQRFEIACYRNKVLDYRAGLETDLSEVLQSDRVFTNVTKGKFAAAADIQKAFHTTDQDKVIRIILDQGKQTQVSDLERHHLMENTLKQIAVWLSHNCVHSVTQRPFSVSQLQAALTNFPVQPHKALKKQELDAVKFLQQNGALPISRARMELSLQFPVDQEHVVQETLDKSEPVVNSRELPCDDSNQRKSKKRIAFEVDPSSYRQLNDLAQSHQEIRLDILQQQVINAASNSATVAGESAAGESSTHSMGRQEDYRYDEEAQQLREKLEKLGIQNDTRQTRQNDNAPNQAMSSKDTTVNASVDKEQEEDESEPEQDSDSDDVLENGESQRKNQKKAKKKKNKKNKRKQQHQQDEEKQLDTSTTPASRDMASDKEAAGTTTSENNVTPTSEQGKRCNTCGGNFPNSADYRAHFRSDWHRFNQKLKVKGLPPVSEKEFLLCDSDAFFS